MAVLWIGALVLAGLCYAAWPRTIDVHSEIGPIEYAQIACWLAAAALAWIAAARGSTWRDRMGAAWMGVLALLAAAREFDLHEAVQREGSGLPPIQFRIDWVLDAAVPLWPKLFWLTLFALVGLALAVPPLVTRAPTARLLRAGDGATWLVLIAIAMLGAGYLADDVLGRGRIGLHIEVTQGIEELFELAGVLAFVMAAWCELRVPLSERLRRLGAPAAASA